MQNNLKYTNLSWAVVGICEGSHMPLSALVHEGDDMEKTVEHYVIGYLAFWHIAFVDESRLVACDDEALREAARQKIDRYIVDHQPVETLPRFYLVLLNQAIGQMDPDGLSQVFTV